MRKMKLSDAIGFIVADDKQAVIRFLRSQGIAIPMNADGKEVVRSLFASFNSDKFKEKFSQWADAKYSSKSNFSGQFANFYDPTDPFGNLMQSTGSGTQPSTTSGNESKGGGFFSGVNVSDILNNGIGIWKTSEQGKQQKDLINAQIRQEEIKLEQLKEQGKISQQQYDAQMQGLQSGSGASGSNMVLYVIGGVVLLGALGTAIYFATRKK